MELFSFRNKLLLGGALLLLIIVFLIFSSLFSLQTTRKAQQTLPTISDEYQTAFSTVNLGTPVSDLEKMPGFKEKRKITATTTEYAYVSPLLAKDNVVQVDNGKVVYTGQVMVDAAHKNPSLSEYLTRFGEPDEVITGSVLYGGFAKTYIYASKGVAFVGSSETDEVFFFQTFTPTTLTAYKTQYGQDIKEVTDREEKIDPKHEAVRLFKLKLPYFGENIAITHDGAEDKTTIYIKNGDVGKAELDKLLLDNNIPSVDWLNASVNQL